MTDSVINVNGKQCDLAKVLPMKLKHLKGALNHGVRLDKIENDLLMQVSFFEYIVTTANPDITIDDIGEMTPAEFKKSSQLVQKLSTVELNAPLENG